MRLVSTLLVCAVSSAAACRATPCGAPTDGATAAPASSGVLPNSVPGFFTDSSDVQPKFERRTYLRGRARIHVTLAHVALGERASRCRSTPTLGAPRRDVPLSARPWKSLLPWIAQGAPNN